MFDAPKAPRPRRRRHRGPRRQRRRKGRNGERVSPPQQTRSLGERREPPAAGSGAEHRPKADLVLFKRYEMPLVEMFVVNWRRIRRRLLMSRGRLTRLVDLPRNEQSRRSDFTDMLRRLINCRIIIIIIIIKRRRYQHLRPVCGMPSKGRVG